MEGMSDGLSDGHRAGIEERERARMMAEYGKSLCLACGKPVDGKSAASVEYDRDTFLQVGLIIDERGRPEPSPKLILFCDAKCGERHNEAMAVVSRAVQMLSRTDQTSPAFRKNLRRHLERVLRTTPNV